MNNLEQRLKDQKKRIKTVSKWKGRIDRIINRKKSPMSEAKFCEKYGFHTAAFNRQKNGLSLPTIKTIEKVDKAFKDEGV